MTKDFNPTEWLTVNEASVITPYAPVTIRLLVREGQIDGLKRGGIWFVSRASVLAYVQEMERLGTAKHDPTRRK